MLEKLFSNAGAISRHREGPIGPYIDVFAEHLAGWGYARSTIRSGIQTVSRFGCWLNEHGFGICDVSEETIAEFLGPRPHPSLIRHGGKAAFHTLLECLRMAGVARSRPEPKGDPSGRIVRDFATHLQQERGLSAATVTSYCPFAARFVSERFGNNPIDLAKLSVADIHSFVSRHAGNYSPKRIQLMLSGLRSFLRFLHYCGKTPQPLADHVFGAPAWRRTQVPKWLMPDDIERVMNCCDCQSLTGQRDHAILLLLARLGLRAGEVVSLNLEDICWETGEITVCGKGPQRKRFPMSEEVGKALSLYLQNARQSCRSRRVFLCARAPYRGFKGSSTVGTIVRKALSRAGLDPPSKGAHLFRHSLATNLLRSGATLTEIGQVLHHTNPDTTSIYAKVDLAGLRALAQPWPGDGS